MVQIDQRDGRVPEGSLTKQLLETEVRTSLPKMASLLSKYGMKTRTAKLPLANKMKMTSNFYTQKVLPKGVAGDQRAVRTSVKKHLKNCLLMSATSGTTGQEHPRLPQIA